MAEIFEFRCEACNYTELICGKRTRRSLGITETIACATCQRLFDVPVEQFDLSEEALDREDEELPWMLVPLRCPEEQAEAPDPVTVWTHPGPCPRCTTTLARSEMAVMDVC